MREIPGDKYPHAFDKGLTLYNTVANIHNTIHYYKTPFYTSYVGGILGGTPERALPFLCFCFDTENTLRTFGLVCAQ